ncbi:MAG: WYL domain-containing protein [Prevotella sp.]|nr:WYL domain-containing protein [Prevotella sp.]
MPVDKQVTLRYKVLNDCFRNRFRMFTINDLVDECNKALQTVYDKQEVSERTIRQDIADLQLPPYNVRFDETLKIGRKRVYRYYDLDYTLPMFRMNDEERNLIQRAICVLEDFEGEPMYDWARMLLMQVGGGLLGDEVSSVVSFQSNPDLEGIAHFNGLLQAIVSKHPLKIQYTPFGKPTISTKVYPYHLKQFNDRWYLIARTVDYDGLTNYALDRIVDFEEIVIPYKEAEVDFNDYFDDVVGVTVPEGDSEDIVIKVSKRRFNYIKTKPLHMSQRVIEESDDYVIVSINVKVNNELEALLLSFGSDVEVLSPESFRTRIAEKIKAMNHKYMNDAENLHT